MQLSVRINTISRFLSSAISIALGNTLSAKSDPSKGTINDLTIGASSVLISSLARISKIGLVASLRTFRDAAQQPTVDAGTSLGHHRDQGIMLRRCFFTSSGLPVSTSVLILAAVKSAGDRL
jgi:hypothetical protein